MKMYYVVNARLPNKKAYGIQIAKMCEAFIEAGVDLELVIPRTHAASKTSMKDFYNLRVEVPTTILPSIDLYASGKFGFLLSSLMFTIGTTILFVYKRIMGEQFFVYTIDMDTFTFGLTTFSATHIVAEMHDMKPSHWLNRMFFRRAQCVVVTNREIRKSLADTFHIESSRMLVEPNGVDLSVFAAHERNTSRAVLHIAANDSIALYAGRFYGWKGLDILVQAARTAPEIHWYVVGGTREEFLRVTKLTDLPNNVNIIAEQTIDALPQWLAAADVLLVLGTKANERSYRHTSPMKVYEYMAVERSIVASKTPALMSFVEEGTVAWYEPDNAADLVRQVRTALTHDQLMIEQGRVAALNHTWDARAQRIIAGIQK